MNWHIPFQVSRIILLLIDVSWFHSGFECVARLTLWLSINCLFKESDYEGHSDGDRTRKVSND